MSDLPAYTTPGAYWSNYMKDQEAKRIARMAGKVVCAHPGCTSPVAARQNVRNYHKPGRYCVDHTPVGGWDQNQKERGRARDKENERRRVWRAQAKERQKVGLPRLRSEGL